MGEDAFDPTYNVQGIDVPLSVIICPEPLVNVGHVPLTVGNIEAPVPPGLDMKPDPLLEPELLDPLELDGGPPELPELLLPLEEVDPVCAPEPPLELPDPLLDELGREPELLPGEVTGGALASPPCELPPLPPELALKEALPEDPLLPLPGREPWFQGLPPPDGAWLHAVAQASAAMASPKMHSEEKRRFDFMGYLSENSR